MPLYAGDGIKFAFGGIAKYGGIAVSGVKNVAFSIASMAKTAAKSYIHRIFEVCKRQDIQP